LANAAGSGREPHQQEAEMATGTQMKDERGTVTTTMNGDKSDG